MKKNVNISNYINTHSYKNKLLRVLWNLTWFILCKWTPRPLFLWRNIICRLFGGKISMSCHIYPTAKIWAPWNLEIGEFSCLGPEVNCYSVAKITIGKHVTISQEAFLCTASHDITSDRMDLITKPIIINDMVWICARSFVGAGVSIGEGAVLGAMSSTMKNISPWIVMSGCPAIYIKERKIEKIGANEKSKHDE